MVDDAKLAEIEAVRENVSHIARGCRSGRSHNPAVHEQAIDVALDALLARVRDLEAEAELLAAAYASVTSALGASSAASGEERNG